MPRADKEIAEEPKRAPRRRVARPKVTMSTETPTAATQRRKAPTQLPPQLRIVRSGGRSMRVYVFAAILLIGFGTAAAIGYSDAGQININAVVSERNARLTAGAASATENGVGEQAASDYVLPVQNTSSLPDGGLNGSGSPDPVPLPPVEVATSSASSTASSTIATTDLETATEDSSTTSPEITTAALGS